MNEKILIGNDCAAGFIYRDIFKTQYYSPFIWSSLSYDLFLQVIENYDKLNFLNVTVGNDKLLDDFYVLIDNKIKLRFSHCKFDKTINTPKIKGINVYYNKIWEYIFETYIKRTKRMISFKMDPIYILHFDKNYLDKFMNGDLKILNNLFKLSKKILILTELSLPFEETKNIKIINLSTTIPWCKDILNNSELIKEKINLLK